MVVPQHRTKDNFHELYFQQDGAPPHNVRTVRGYLYQEFPQRWFGRRGSIEWPPCSSDLTLMDFFLGFLSRTMFMREIPTINELKNYISDAFIEIDGDLNLCCTVCFGQI